MTVAYWCVLAAALMPSIVAAIAKAGVPIDNHAPYEAVDKLQGYRRRAHAAHLNAFEAFPFFAVAVIIAHLQGAAQPTLDALSIGWLVLRVIYTAFYLGNQASPRTATWIAATLLSVAIFTTPLWA